MLTVCLVSGDKDINFALSNTEDSLDFNDSLPDPDFVPELIRNF